MWGLGKIGGGIANVVSSASNLIKSEIAGEQPKKNPDQQSQTDFLKNKVTQLQNQIREMIGKESQQKEELRRVISQKKSIEDAFAELDEEKNRNEVQLQARLKEVQEKCRKVTGVSKQIELDRLKQQAASIVRHETQPIVNAVLSHVLKILQQDVGPMSFDDIPINISILSQQQLDCIVRAINGDTAVINHKNAVQSREARSQLEQQIKKYTYQTDKLRQQIDNLQRMNADLTNSNRIVKLQFDSMNGEHNRLRQVISSLKYQRQQLMSQISVLERQKSVFKRQIGHVSEQLSCLNQKYKQSQSRSQREIKKKDKEIEQLMGQQEQLVRKQTQIQNKDRIIGTIQQEMRSLADNLHDTQRKLAIQSKQNTSREEQIRINQQSIQQMNTHIHKLQTDSNNMLQHIQWLTRQYENMATSIEVYYSQNIEEIQQLKTLSRTLQDVPNRLNNISSRTDNQQTMLKQKLAESEEIQQSLFMEMQQYKMEIQSLAASLEQWSSKATQFKNQIAQLHEQNSRIIKENQLFKESVSQSKSIIKGLKEKEANMQSKCAELLQQYHKSRRILADTTRQLQCCKQQIQQLLYNHKRSSMQNKNMEQELRKQQQDRKGLEDLVGSLRQQLNHQTQQTKIKEEDIKQLRKQHEQSEQIYRCRLEDLQNKIHMISNESERFRQITMQLKYENCTLTEKLSDKESRVSRQLEDSRARNLQLTNQLVAAKVLQKKLEKQLEEIQILYKQSTEEVERLTNRVQQMQKQQQSAKQNNSHELKEAQEKYRQSELQVSQLQLNVNHLEVKNQQLERQNSQLNHRYLQCLQSIQEYTKKCSQMEIMLETKSTSLREMQNKLAEMAHNQKQTESILIQVSQQFESSFKRKLTVETIKDLQQKWQAAGTKYMELMKESEETLTKLKQKEQQLRSRSDAAERVQLQLAKNIQQLERSRTTVNQLESMVEQMNKEVTDRDNVIMKQQNMEENVKKLQNLEKQHQEEIRKLAEQSKVYRTQMEDLENGLKRQIRIKDTEIEKISQQNQKNHQEIGQLRSAKQTADDEIKKMQQTVHNLTNNLQEKEKLLVAKQTQLTNQKKNLQNLQSKLQQLHDSTDKYDELQQHCQNMNQKLLMKDEEIKKIIEKNGTLMKTIQSLEDGLETNQAYLDEKGSQNDRLQEMLTQLEATNKEKEKEVDRLSKQVLMLTKQLQNSSKIKTIPSTQPNLIDLTVIKNIFLKYFEPNTTIENRLHAVDTLCSVLQTTQRQRESLQLYKKRIVERESAMRQVEQRKKESKPIQQKFYSFLARQDDD